MNRTTKINVLAYASRPEMDINYFGDIVEYQGKRYFVSLSEEVVEFRGIYQIRNYGITERRTKQYVGKMFNGRMRNVSKNY